MSTADAVDRETAWLSTVGDGLPALLASSGGAWDVVQAYMPRTPATRGNQIYVLRRNVRSHRVSNARRRPLYEFELKLIWPLQSGTGQAEADQRNFDAAVDAILARVVGPLGDKTHGGRFLSAAEVPDLISVRVDDPERTIPEGRFTATVLYSVDDNEIVT